MERLLLDTDIGSDADDAMALALALNSPELKIEAVTTVYGDTILRARIAARLMQLAGREDIPVYPGINLPLLRKRPVVWFGHEGEGVPGLQGELPSLRNGRAVEAIVSTIIANPGEITVVAIGPLTNLAAAIVVEPSVAERVKRIIIMGGVVGCGGAFSPADPIEHNFKCDPEAAAVVLGAGSPITLVGLDVTRRVLFESHHARMLRDSGGVLGRVLADLIEGWWRARQVQASNMHDPLALGLAIDPTFVSTKRMKVWVDCQSSDLAGAIIAREARDSLVDVAVDVDPMRFLAFMLERICGDRPRSPRGGSG